MSEAQDSGLARFRRNLRDLKRSFLGSFLREGMPVSDRTRASTMFNNFFLHVQGVKTHRNTLRPTYTLGLGLISLFLLLIVVASGALLMVYYNPSLEHAYNTVKDINYVVFGGRLVRNIHKWAGEGMIIFVLLHMARVFYTGSYGKGREFNWVVGIGLLVLTFGLNLSGYMLPWDQLAYWALVIVSNIIQSPREVTDALGITHYLDVGGFFKELFLGGTVAGKESLNRVYALHIMFLPLFLFVLLGVHFWRIRKDGGLTRPEEDPGAGGADREGPAVEKSGGVFPTYKTYGLMELARGRTPAVDTDVENTVLSWPNLLVAELAVLVFTLAAVLIYAFYVDAPLKELANPMIPENPAKAPWYFLGLQELLSYSAFTGGVALPGLALAGLALIPYLDREPGHVGVWFSGPRGRRIALEALAAGALANVALLAFVVRVGWLRNWWPDVPQLLITVVNPGTIWVGFMIAWSLWVVKRTDSTRMGAVALFTMFLVSYVIFTAMGTYFRGPNWGFFWSRSQWPVH